MRRIETPADIADGLDALCTRDPRLVAVRASVGEVPLRLVEPGFASLAAVVIGQQVSRASAAAMLARLAALVDPLTPEGLVAAGEDAMRAAGLSRAKQRTLGAIADAVADGLDLEALTRLPAQAAIARLSAVHGIGPWTAGVYLLFGGGHADILPARDVALQSAVGRAFAIHPRPGERQLAGIAESWSPWRGVAARLFWAYYSETAGREAVPVPAGAETA